MEERIAPQAEERTVEVQAHEVAMASNIRDVVRGLVDALGATMVAAIGGVSETRAVKQWMTDRDPQRPNTLRFALQLAWIIAEKSAWFQGVNPHLNDAVPLLLLRERSLLDIQGPLMSAARAFPRKSQLVSLVPKPHTDI